MTVYWVSQHYADMAGIRQRQGLASHASTPPFLVTVHASAMDHRDPALTAEGLIGLLERRLLS
jgi:hypothetical protein